MVVPLGELYLILHVLEIPSHLSDGNTKYSRPSLNPVTFFLYYFLVVLPDLGIFFLYIHKSVFCQNLKGPLWNTNTLLAATSLQYSYYEDFSHMSHKL